MEFMPEHAPLVVLTFLGSIFVLGAAVLAFLFGAFRRHRRLELGGLAVAALVVSGYALVLLGVSLTSHEKTLARGEWKYFCEIDCHIAYSVEDVTQAKTLGPETQQTSANGSFFIVRLKTWFDPRTISAHRGNGPLTPNPRRVVLVDDHGLPAQAGHEYAPSPAGQAALVKWRGNTTPLSQPLRPGESYSTDLVFDLPAGALHPRLFITNADAVRMFSSATRTRRSIRGSTWASLLLALRRLESLRTKDHLERAACRGHRHHRQGFAEREDRQRRVRATPDRQQREHRNPESEVILWDLAAALGSASV